MEKQTKFIQAPNENRKSSECKSCGKSFSSSQSLRKHIHTIHNGHKDYKCESCSKFFAGKGDLKKHIHRIHDEQI